MRSSGIASGSIALHADVVIEPVDVRRDRFGLMPVTVLMRISIPTFRVLRRDQSTLHSGKTNSTDQQHRASATSMRESRHGLSTSRNRVRHWLGDTPERRAMAPLAGLSTSATALALCA